MYCLKLLRHFHRNIPNVFCIFDNGSIAGEFPRIRHIENGFLGPLVRVLIFLRDLILNRAISLKIRADEKGIGEHEIVREGFEDSGLHGRKEIAPHHIEDLFQVRRFLDKEIRIVAATFQLQNLMGFQTEREDIVRSHGLRDLDIGSIVRSDGQRAVHHELHTAGPGSFRTRSRDLLREIARRKDILSQRDTIILEEHDLELVAVHFVVIDHGRDVIDELDNEFCEKIARRGFSGKNERPRCDRRVWILPKLQILGDRVENEKGLAFVLVDPLNLNIEYGIKIDQDPSLAANDL